jgi:hypothetical protein
MTRSSKAQSMSKSVWETLSAIDCNGHTEEKNGFTYLSWAWAWSTLKKHYPNARFEKNGVQYLEDNTALACVHVWIDGEEGSRIESVTEFLPVLDYKNKPVANPNCFDINSAYQRCLVKCMAYMGLGMYIYQGETINQNATLQFEVKSVSGESEKTEDLSGLKDVMLKFMVGPDGTTTLNNLRQFWAINKTPLEQMERLDPESYKSVYDAFMKKAEELKEKTA